MRSDSSDACLFVCLSGKIGSTYEDDFVLSLPFPGLRANVGMVDEEEDLDLDLKADDSDGVSSGSASEGTGTEIFLPLQSQYSTLHWLHQLVEHGQVQYFYYFSVQCELRAVQVNMSANLSVVVCSDYFHFFHYSSFRSWCSHSLNEFNSTGTAE